MLADPSGSPAIVQGETRHLAVAKKSGTGGQAQRALRFSRFYMFRFFKKNVLGLFQVSVDVFFQKLLTRIENVSILRSSVVPFGKIFDLSSLKGDYRSCTMALAHGLLRALIHSSMLTKTLLEGFDV